MNSDELFDKFPDILFGSTKKQMLLGMLPAETVEIILEPLLSNFHALMLQLPSGLQTDFENILRIYPDIAERFSLSVKPPIQKSLTCLAQHLAPRFRQDPTASGVTGLEMDFAAEEQKELSRWGSGLLKEGQGYFRTDRGNSVYLEFAYSIQEGCLYFAHKPAGIGIDIFICGTHALTLVKDTGRKRLPVARLSEICGRYANEMAIKVTEV